MKSFKHLALILFLLPVASLADTLTGKVIDVHDGDTLTIQVPGDNSKYRVRLLGVDTPEVDFFGNTQGEAAFKARDFVRSLAPVGSTVSVVYDTNGVDKHDRILGRVMAGNVDINSEVLRQGLGYLYFIFPFDKGVAKAYSDIARTAAENHLGLFSNAYQNVLAPYDFRMSVRNQTGTNLIGNLESKELFYQTDAAKVPVWRRVFFSDRQMAEQNGYHFN